MNARTCAACDSELGADPIAVTVADQRVEVCCDACADALGEAQAAVAAARLVFSNDDPDIIAGEPVVCGLRTRMDKPA